MSSFAESQLQVIRSWLHQKGYSMPEWNVVYCDSPFELYSLIILCMSSLWFFAFCNYLKASFCSLSLALECFEASLYSNLLHHFLLCLILPKKRVQPLNSFFKSKNPVHHIGVHKILFWIPKSCKSISASLWNMGHYPLWLPAGPLSTCILPMSKQLVECYAWWMPCQSQS